MYLWYDLETTGLDPERDRILEIAAVLTGPDLVPVQRWHLPVRAPQYVLTNLTPFILDMHTKNGLLAEIPGGVSLAQAEDVLLSMISNVDKPILAGFSIQFDRGFTKHWMPTFESKLSHRMLDVSSLKMLYRDATGTDPWKEQIAAHRAMAGRRGVDQRLQARQVALAS